MTVKQLREEAKSLGMKGYTSLKKSELIEAIEKVKSQNVNLENHTKVIVKFKSKLEKLNIEELKELLGEIESNNLLRLVKLQIMELEENVVSEELEVNTDELKCIDGFTYRIIEEKKDGFYIRRFNKFGDQDLNYGMYFINNDVAVMNLKDIEKEFIKRYRADLKRKDICYLEYLLEDTKEEKLIKLINKEIERKVKIEKKYEKELRETRKRNEIKRQDELNKDIKDLSTGSLKDLLKETKKEDHKRSIIEEIEKRESEKKELIDLTGLEGLHSKLDSFIEGIRIKTIEFYKKAKELKRKDYNEARKKLSLNDIAVCEMAICEIIKLIDRQMKSKKEDFLQRINSKITGDIIEAHLELGNDYSINGYIKTENNEEVDVTTVIAGGYNIQKIHYRVLVKIKK